MSGGRTSGGDLSVDDLGGEVGNPRLHVPVRPKACRVVGVPHGCLHHLGGDFSLDQRTGGVSEDMRFAVDLWPSDRRHSRYKHPSPPI